MLISIDLVCLLLCCRDLPGETWCEYLSGDSTDTESVLVM